jgi:hypothetical protein
MLTHEESEFYDREIKARRAALRAVFAERGLPDWLETVSYHGRIFRDWHPVQIGARRYGLSAHAVWDESGTFGFQKSIVRLLCSPKFGRARRGFRTLREARETAAQINAALQPEDRYPLVEEIKVAMIEKERAAVHDARQRDITKHRCSLRLVETV